jgi:hypothetical protein
MASARLLTALYSGAMGKIEQRYHHDVFSMLLPENQHAKSSRTRVEAHSWGGDHFVPVELLSSKTPKQQKTFS